MASSSAVYGTSGALPCRESQLPAPESPYGASKVAAEYYLHALGRLHHVETVALRYFNVFGPGQDPTSEYAAVMPRFTMAVLANQPPVINGTGEISRDFVYVDNVVAANLLAAESSNPSGVTFNIGSGLRSSLFEILESIETSAGRRIQPVFGPARIGDILHSEADISFARIALGYKVKVALEEGIDRTVDWYRNG